MANEKIMSRIMKLMERANHPETPTAERESCMDKAEALMAQHMIDRADLKPEAKSSVVQDVWDLQKGDVDSEFYFHVRDLMLMVLKHCGARVHPKESYGKKDDGTTDWGVKQFTVVGFPEDMMYAEQIWFRVFKEFVSNISPRWDPSKSLEDNTYAFIKAGYSWIDTYRVARRIQYSDWPEQMPNGGPRLRRAYKAALEARGEEFSKTRTREAYRNTFVRSYSSTIRQRLDEMRAKSKETVGDADKFALALRTTKERVDEEFYRLFPEYDPEMIRRMKAAEELARQEAWDALDEETQGAVLYWEAENAAAVAAQDAAWRRKWEGIEKAAATKRARYGHVQSGGRRETYDHSAWERGRDVGRKVNLSVDPEMKNRKRGELQ